MAEKHNPLLRFMGRNRGEMTPLTRVRFGADSEMISCAQVALGGNIGKIEKNRNDVPGLVHQPDKLPCARDQDGGRHVARPERL